jgi:xylan 1,4-beta-xylosidase
MRILLSVFLLLLFVCSPAYPQSSDTITNPILAGFYPDPSICKVGQDYYLVNSTFAYFPGIPVFHSRDLVHWKLISHVLDRPEQLNLDKQGVSRGLFAPAIRYSKGVFYVTCTLVDIGGNFVVSAKRPEGPWSMPVWQPEVDGIDPSLFFDDNGKAYLVYNSAPPDNKPLYSGHRTLRIRDFNFKSLRVTGKEDIIVNGGVDISKKPVWIEGPHIFKRKGYYYLIAAEGGTAENHSEVVFRSKNIKGPFTPYAENPILTQRDLDPARPDPVTCTGHADFVQAPNGDWWSVFLGCRPYADDYFNTGRETFMAPVEWKNGWPVINPKFRDVQYCYSLPIRGVAPAGRPYNGNFAIRDEYDSAELDRNWVFLRTPHERWYDLSSRKGFLTLNLRPETCAGDRNPVFLGQRQQHLVGSASMALDFSPAAENEKAGLLVFQNETHFYFFCKSKKGTQSALELYRSGPREMELLDSVLLNDTQQRAVLFLKIDAIGDRYAFSYTFDTRHWLLLRNDVDARFLSTKVAGGFVGCMYAMYATSSGVPSGNNAYVDWFEYSGNDAVYKRK